jgi:hypothetical protein
MDVEAWLKGLGLERYAERFAASEITWQVVPQLTDADLRELGLPLGPRKILLAAIATLRHDPTPGVRGDERPTGASAPDAVPGHEVERRHLTVTSSSCPKSSVARSSEITIGSVKLLPKIPLRRKSIFTLRWSCAIDNA